MQFKDQLQRDHYFAASPDRIICLVPSITELLVYLGLEQQIIGITKFCIEPTYLKKKKVIVGGTKQIKTEKIKALNPSIVIANKEENTKEIVAACEEIAPVWVTDIYTLNDVYEMVYHFGVLFNKEVEAIKLNNLLKNSFLDFSVFIKDKPLKKVAYLIWKNPYMVAGNNTFINSLLKLNHFENIFEGLSSRYPEIKSNQLKEADLILLSSEPYPFKEQDVEFLKKETKKPVLLVDGAFFSWYGSRLLDAFKYFKTLH